MLEGGAKRTPGNMFLWITVAVISMIGLGLNVYQHNTGAQTEIDWALIISEVGIFLAAMLFIVDYFKKRKEKKEEEK